ncbi:MAG: hypothetical protein GY711_23385 [bacterium]|nr:hypothetical protein [bacterium]
MKVHRMLLFWSALAVRNFGVGGTTLLRGADRPYVRTEQRHAALAWAPDVAIVMLGTNDSCQNGQRRSWDQADALGRDIRALVADLREVRGDVRILLAGPTGMFPDAKNLTPARVADLEARAPRLAIVRAAKREAARELEIEVRRLDARAASRLDERRRAPDD